VNSEVVSIDVLGGINTGDRNSMLVEVYDQNGKSRFLMIDCGVGIKGFDDPLSVPLRPRKTPEVIAITHAHIDHSLLSPRYFADYGSRFYLTGPTYLTMEFLFKDHLMNSNRSINPKEALFTEEEMVDFYCSEKTIPIWDDIHSDSRAREIFPGVWLKFYHNGHIRGSAMVLLSTDRHKIVFSGDVSTFDTPTVKGINLDSEVLKNFSPDIVFLESTNGNVELPNREEEINRMVDFAKNCRLALIPAFGVGRSPDLALDLARRNFPVYLDGMGKKILRAYAEKMFYWSSKDEKVSEEYINSEIKFVKDRHHRHIIKYDEKPKAIVTTGGMGNGLALQYAEYWLQRNDAVIFKTGYAAENTPGAKLLKSIETGMPFEIKPGKGIKIEAQVEEIKLSGHNDARQSVELIKTLDPKKIYLNHGEKDRKDELSSILNESGFDAESLEKIGQTIYPK